MAKNKTTDAVEILRRQFLDGDEEMEALVAESRQNLEIGEQIYRLRTEAGLTLQQLATLVGTTASAICRLENADYDGHSLSMLRRIADALDNNVEVRFIPKKLARQPIARKAK